MHFVAVFPIVLLASASFIPTAHSFQCRNYTATNLFAATDACSYHQLIDPHAPAPTRLRGDHRGGTLDALAFARHSMHETQRMYAHCRATNRWNYDVTRQVCHQLLARSDGRSAGACRRVRHELDAHWMRMYGAYFASAREQMQMADQAMLRFEAALPRWAYAHLEAKLLPLRQQIAINVRATDRFMGDHERGLWQLVANFEVLCERAERPDRRVDLLDGTLDDVDAVLARTEDEIQAIQARNVGICRSALLPFGV